MGGIVSPDNAPFLVAICVMLAIGALEGLFLLMGAGLSQHIDSFLAQLHIGAPDSDGVAAAGSDAPDAPDHDGGVLGWLHVGRAPILVLLVIFLMAFAISGLLLQWSLHGLLGHTLQPWLASVVAVAIAVPVVR